MAPFNGIPTYSQQITLALIPKFTSALSICGSAYIIYDVLRNKKGKTAAAAGPRQRSSYHRLLVGMSACDLSMSGGLFLSTWPMPKDVPNVWGNVGNTQTCTMQGFFEQWGVATVMYSASLSIYYLITIRTGRFASRARIRRIEPILHVVPLVFGLATSVASLVLRLFNYGLFDCWIAPMPQGCKESWQNEGSTTCVRGDNASLYQWLFDLIPKWTSILIVTVNMVLVYLHVRKQELASQRWSSKTANVRGLLGSSSMASASLRQSSSLNDARFSISSSTSPHQQGGQASQSTQRQQQQVRRRQSSTTSSTNTNSASRQIAHQSYLYVGALWITWMSVIVLRATQLASGVTYYWMLIWVVLSIPTQGFWNVLVYLRPRWLQKRKEQRERAATEKRQREAAESSSVGGRLFNGKAAFALRDFSVAAVNTVRQGDIEEEEEGGNRGVKESNDAAFDNFELESNNKAHTIGFGREERVSSVTFASQVVVSNVENIDHDDGETKEEEEEDKSPHEKFNENQ